ncbi:hypothetical protein MYSTI_05964 [Myxococcus stipitatus DSM 14675]|uniref:Uncharacterized protein n=1 Tax=Myxococcus stipitatus (strain DSM 14675 / JCM 12634 / Mx s8) TaxID=1278073 RepID=L7UI49_MYXSD|nr:hypothetical protein [Myxococcus stipitatus]AGC47237.1 hypothetical protein MYSTI_05964 [Myxococcus stipitatus DSM 14675]
MTAEERQQLVEQARDLLTKHVVRWEEPAPWAEHRDSSYTQLAVAVRQALAGDSGAIPTLRRVFGEPFFARTNSHNEYGMASLGLALLGDRESLELIRGVMPINLNRETRPLALALLEEPSARSND